MVAKKSKASPTKKGLLSFQSSTDGDEPRLMMASFRAGVRKIYTDKLIEKQVLFFQQQRLIDPSKQRDPETGRVWPRLGSTTVKRRKKNRLTGQVKLHDTGSMLKALYIKRSRLVDAAGVKGAGVSTVTFRDRVSKSSPRFLVVEIARIHQFGKDKVPPRPFLGLARKEGKEIEKIFDLRLARSTPGFGNPMS